jgi:hypothetical protein
MKNIIYLKNNKTGLFWKARLIKRRKAYRITHYTPAGEVSASTKQPWAYMSEAMFTETLKRNRVLKNKPTKAQINKVGWFGKNPPSWVKQAA